MVLVLAMFIGGIALNLLLALFGIVIMAIVSVIQYLSDLITGPKDQDKKIGK